MKLCFEKDECRNILSYNDTTISFQYLLVLTNKFRKTKAIK